jgi:hypothetical protein
LWVYDGEFPFSDDCFNRIKAGRHRNSLHGRNIVFGYEHEWPVIFLSNFKTLLQAMATSLPWSFEKKSTTMSCGVAT